MVFSVLTPRQLRSFEAGRHRIQFLFQQPEIFAAVNRAPWLADLKSESGFAKAAGVELTLLDCTRYFPKAGGINGIAEVLRDIGEKANSKSLAKTADVYENFVVQRLGLLLENFGHDKQGRAVRPFAERAKSVKPLNPAAKFFLAKSAAPINTDWQLLLNQTIEVDE